MDYEANLKALGYVLPPPPKPEGVYTPFILVPEQGMLLVSGHGPMRQQNGDTAYTYVVGKVGVDMGKEDGRKAAHDT
eukprot:gene25987-20207_t